MKTLEECRAANGGKVWEATIGGTVEEVIVEVNGVKAKTARRVGGRTFIFRRPSTREWLEFEAASLVVQAGATVEAFRALQLASEDLCVRVVVSHSPEELQAINEEFFGIFVPLAAEIADVVNGLRNSAGKALSAPGGG